jgi:hypothetical protein
MLSTLVALALFATASELPQSQQSGPPPSGEAPPADDAVDQSGAEPANGSGAEEPVPEEEEDRVCSRRTDYDMLGRPRSRKVCRPR